MEYSELKGKSVADLTELVNTMRSELRDLRFKAAGRQLKQVHKLAVLRTDIARITAILSGRATK